MKSFKILLITAIVIASAVIGITQNTTIRGTDKRSVTVAGSDAAGADTITIYPRNYETIVDCSCTDSIVYMIGNKAGARKNDRLIFNITDVTGGCKVKINGTHCEFLGADSLMTVTSTKRAHAEYYFDGVKYMQRFDAVVQ